VLLPVRMARYREVSRQILTIFGRFTDLVEPLSIDEAFLDVTASVRLFGPGQAIAERIRREVRAETDLAVSAGVAPNKFLAKLASEAAKPDGLLEVTVAGIDHFLLPLPVSRLWGVGKVTAERLERLGLRTVADLRRAGREVLMRHLGSAGEHLFQLAYGEDVRPVVPAETVKSVGQEETFERDLLTPEELHRHLLALADGVAWRLRRRQEVGRCLTLKVRYDDFGTVTRSRTLDAGTDHAMTIFRRAEELLGHTDAGRRPVRLLGLSLSRLTPRGSGQQELFAEKEQERIGALDRALDSVTERFGSGAIGRGTLMPVEAGIAGRKKSVR
jgi:DNA polymerase-4